jgi:coenzyme F420-0:L-glutamate ligase / coenzyme F420-1:gamma-L-glutamate ligase
VIEIHPLKGLPEVAAGDPLGRMLANALRGAELAPTRGDVLVVTQKIVSKAEGRFVRLDDITPSARARELAEVTGKDPRLVELVLQESSAILRAAPNVLIARHKLGLVMANAGIDRSNVGAAGDDLALLLPADPDASARALAAALEAAFGAPIAVVLSDSFGRPWRLGVVNVAIGAWGLPALVDRRGETDRDGRRLEVTQVAVADLLASAAGLAMGEGAEGVPAALVRGCDLRGPSAPASALLRALQEDLFN